MVIARGLVCRSLIPGTTKSDTALQAIRYRFIYATSAVGGLPPLKKNLGNYNRNWILRHRLERQFAFSYAVLLVLAEFLSFKYFCLQL